MDEPTDLDRWLQVWEQHTAAVRTSNDHEAVNHLIEGFYQLLTLIEPPSVKVARLLSGSDAEASSRT